jgi:hypothetical protein
MVSEFERGRGGPNWRLIGGILAAVLILGLAGWFGRGLISSNNTANSGSAPPSPAAAQSPKSSPKSSPKASPSPSAVPGQVPVFAPPAAGGVKGVALKADSASCLPGATCTFNVVITFTPTGSPHDVTWSFKTYDLCTTAQTSLNGGLITADGSWNTTDGNTTISLPQAKGQLAVVALSGPDVAASSPLLLGTAGGC